MLRQAVIAAGILTPLQLTACAALAPPRWYKDGATQQEFASDRYTCLQQSQQRVSGAYVNQYGGAPQDTVITNGQLFGARMNANGMGAAPRTVRAAFGRLLAQGSWVRASLMFGFCSALASYC
jgi:hypothetical protein